MTIVVSALGMIVLGLLAFGCLILHGVGVRAGRVHLGWVGLALTAAYFMLATGGAVAPP